MSARRLPLIAAALACAALAGTAHGSTPSSRVITDAAGDANGTSALTTSPSTAPASLDTADLRHVDLRRDADRLELRFGLTALPDTSGDQPQTLYRLSATSGTCSFHLFLAIGSLTPGAGTTGGITPLFDPVSGCPDDATSLTGDSSWTARTDATSTELVASFPIDSLTARIPGLAPGARLTKVSADSNIGTVVINGGANTPNFERFTTAVIDAAPGGLDYVIPCLEQEC